MFAPLVSNWFQHQHHKERVFLGCKFLTHSGLIDTQWVEIRRFTVSNIHFYIINHLGLPIFHRFLKTRIHLLLQVNYYDTEFSHFCLTLNHYVRNVIELIILFKFQKSCISQSFHGGQIVFTSFYGLSKSYPYRGLGSSRKRWCYIFT